jgi:hypothetical protein
LATACRSVPQATTLPIRATSMAYLSLEVGIALIEDLPIVQCAAQELRWLFARSNSTHPNGSVEIDLRTPFGIFSAFDSEKHKSAR